MCRAVGIKLPNDVKPAQSCAVITEGTLMDKWVVPATIFGMLFAVAVAWIFDSAWAFLAAMIILGIVLGATRTFIESD